MARGPLHQYRAAQSLVGERQARAAKVLLIAGFSLWCGLNEMFLLEKEKGLLRVLVTVGCCRSCLLGSDWQGTKPKALCLHIHPTKRNKLGTDAIDITAHHRLSRMGTSRPSSTLPKTPWVECAPLYGSISLRHSEHRKCLDVSLVRRFQNIQDARTSRGQNDGHRARWRVHAVRA